MSSELQADRLQAVRKFFRGNVFTKSRAEGRSIDANQTRHEQPVLFDFRMESKRITGVGGIDLRTSHWDVK